MPIILKFRIGDHEVLKVWTPYFDGSINDYLNSEEVTVSGSEEEIEEAKRLSEIIEATKEQKSKTDTDYESRNMS